MNKLVKIELTGQSYYHACDVVYEDLPVGWSDTAMSLLEQPWLVVLQLEPLSAVTESKGTKLKIYHAQCPHCNDVLYSYTIRIEEMGFIVDGVTLLGSVVLTPYRKTAFTPSGGDTMFFTVDGDFITAFEVAITESLQMIYPHLQKDNNE